VGGQEVCQRVRKWGSEVEGVWEDVRSVVKDWGSGEVVSEVEDVWEDERSVRE